MIKGLDSNFKMSFSQNRVYCDCPKKYEFRYLKKIPEPSNPYLDLGNAIHLLCEHHFYAFPKSITQEELIKAKELVISDRGQLYYDQLSNELAEFFNNKTMLFNEHKFENDDFVCKVDTAYRYLDGICVADFKVTKKPKTVDSVYDEGQLLLYSNMLRNSQEYHDEKIYVQYINILSYRADKIVTTTAPMSLSDEVCQNFVDGMSSNMEAINNRIFPKKTKYCKWCYYKDMCDTIL